MVELVSGCSCLSAVVFFFFADRHHVFALFAPCGYLDFTSTRDDVLYNAQLKSPSWNT